MCACMREREGEREGKREREREGFSMSTLQSYATDWHNRHYYTCYAIYINITTPLLKIMSVM